MWIHLGSVVVVFVPPSEWSARQSRRQKQWSWSSQSEYSTRPWSQQPWPCMHGGLTLSPGHMRPHHTAHVITLAAFTSTAMRLQSVQRTMGQDAAPSFLLDPPGLRGPFSSQTFTAPRQADHKDPWGGQKEAMQVRSTCLLTCLWMQNGRRGHPGGKVSSTEVQWILVY